MSKHHARCHCGNLDVICVGDPSYVSMCHCDDCQRRTGSTYNVGAWFEKQNITISGDSHVYTRIEHDGIEMSYHFCPVCGSSVFWESPRIQTSMGVAVGCFSEVECYRPTVSFFEERRHSWVEVPNKINRYMRGVQSK